MTDPTVSLSYVQALWSYSEIVDSNFAHCYDNQQNIDTLRAKRRGRVPFTALSADERYGLAFMCASIRNPLMVFLAGIEDFQRRSLHKSQIATLIVPPAVLERIEAASFETYINTSHPDPRDPRNVAARPEGYQNPTDPLTIGRYQNNLVLLDGYHRAAAFWKFAPADALIQSFYPQPLAPLEPSPTPARA
jgi:hypothetical protein